MKRMLKRRNVLFLNKVRRIAFANEMSMAEVVRIINGSDKMLFRMHDKLVEQGEPDGYSFIALANPRSGYVHGYRFTGIFNVGE